jgi:small-conductance mechanosensitive channel
MDNIGDIFNPEANSFWNLLLATVVVVVSIFLARLARRRLRTFLDDYGLDEHTTALLARVGGWTVVLLGVVLALSIMGVDMQPVVLIIVIFAALLFLSGRTLIENWAAGLVLQSRAPYEPGDRIESLGFIGYVEETNVRSVVIRTGDGQIIHIPNIDVLSNPLNNRTGHEGLRRSSITYGVAYGTNLSETERLLANAAASVDGVLDEPKPPEAHVASLGDTTVNIELRFWHHDADRHHVRSAVGHEALRRLDEASVSLPFPTKELIVSGTLDRSAEVAVPPVSRRKL